MTRSARGKKRAPGGIGEIEASTSRYGEAGTEMDLPGALNMARQRTLFA